MRTGFCPSMATPRKALIESNSPVYWMSNRARAPAQYRPLQIDIPSSSLQTCTTRKSESCMMVFNKLWLVVRSGKAMTNRMPVFLSP